MEFSPRLINRFLIFKLPSAYLCGVRVKSIDQNSCKVRVRYSWLNSNPFRSMFWAVQGMAAELSTGALILANIKSQDADMSMLLVENTGEYYKKAVGRITFTCHDGARINVVIDNAIKQDQPGEMVLEATGTNEEGDTVSRHRFKWSVKLRSV